MTERAGEAGNGREGAPPPARRERVQANLRWLIQKHRKALKLLEAYDTGEIARPRARRPVKS